MNTDNNHPSHPSGEQPLESWKEIASYLQRDARTVARWEKEEGLPVHRLRHHRRATVYAYPSELEQWKTDRKPGDSSDPTPRTWTRTTWGVAATALMGIALWAVARGPILNPPGAHVEAARNDGVTVRRLWSGETDKPLVLGDANGKTSIYADYDTGELMVLNLETGEKQKHPEVTSWSSGTCDSLKLAPSGLQAACSWWHPGTGKYELRILSLDGGETRTLLSYAEGQAVRPYDWSRDGKQLLVTVIRSDATIQIGIVSVPEATLRIVKSLEWRRPRNLSFSPDGQYIAYDAPLDPRSQNRDIFSLAVDGSSETPMVEHLSADYSPYWTPDGNGILFFSDRNDEQSAWLQPIEKGRPLGSPRLVRKDTQQIYPLGFDRSGVFYWGQFTDESGLYLADVDFEKGQFVSEPRHLRLRLGRSINDIPFWSADGKFLNYPLALGPRQADEAALVIREVETEEERAIYPNLRYLLTRYWYRDGDAFLVESRDARGREGIFRVDAQTGEEVAIHRNTRGGEVHEFCRRPQLSPDERFLFCLDKYASGEALLYRHDLESGKDLELYRWAKSELPGFHRVSPDGRWLAFLRSDPENPADSQLMLVPSKGGEPHVLYSAQDVQFLFISTWTPDSRWILLSQPGKGSKEILYQVSADGSIARPLRAYLGGEQPMLGGRGFDVHPNGRTVAMKILGEGGSEIWAMDNIGVRKADSE